MENNFNEKELMIKNCSDCKQNFYTKFDSVICNDCFKKNAILCSCGKKFKPYVKDQLVCLKCYQVNP